MRPRLASLAALLVLTGAAGAAETTVTLRAALPEGDGPELGTITLRVAGEGTLIVPDLHGIPAGLHGFHLHEKGDCQPARKGGEVLPAGAAGDHYDPHDGESHTGPYDQSGHRGDLPALYADPTGAVTLPVLAPHIKLNDFAGRALVLHAGGDNYSDTPPLGGGGARLACGLVPK